MWERLEKSFLFREGIALIAHDYVCWHKNLYNLVPKYGEMAGDKKLT